MYAGKPWERNAIQGMAQRQKTHPKVKERQKKGRTVVSGQLVNQR